MKIVRKGRWLYGGAVYLPVDIISLDYDFWFEIAKVDDQLNPDEVPTPLNTEGVLYYARFTHAGTPSTPTWPDSSGYTAVDDAIRAAQEMTPTAIEWDEPAAGVDEGS